MASRFWCWASAPIRRLKWVAKCLRKRVLLGGMFNNWAIVSTLKRGSRTYKKNYSCLRHHISYMSALCFIICKAPSFSHHKWSHNSPVKQTAWTSIFKLYIFISPKLVRRAIPDIRIPKLGLVALWSGAFGMPLEGNSLRQCAEI